MAASTPTARRRLFTPASANAALPYVRAVVADIQETFGRLEQAKAARRKSHARRGVSQGPGDGDAERAAAAAERELRRLVGELDRAGVELKDPARGLVDFPAELAGVPALLCWVAGEPSVAFWHSPESGFAGRVALPPDDGAPAAGGPAMPGAAPGDEGPPDAAPPRRPIRRRTP